MAGAPAVLSLKWLQEGHLLAVLKSAPSTRLKPKTPAPPHQRSPLAENKPGKRSPNVHLGPKVPLATVTTACSLKSRFNYQK